MGDEFMGFELGLKIRREMKKRVRKMMKNWDFALVFECVDDGDLIAAAI